MAQSALRTATAGLIGNVLEWFDFAVYGYFSTDIGKHVEIFPVRARVTSMSIAYSITLALAGGTAPLVSTWLIDTLGLSAESPAFYIMIYGAIGLAIMWPMAETNGRSLDA